MCQELARHKKTVSKSVFLDNMRYRADVVHKNRTNAKVQK